jgi:spoIIIJ-associated protein
MDETNDENARGPGETGDERPEGSVEGAPAAAAPATAEEPATGAAPAPEAPAAVHADEAGEGGGAAAPEKLLAAKDVVEGLLQRLGIDAAVEVRDGPEAIACGVRVRSGGELFATGLRGQVLEAAQYLVNKMINRDAEGRKWVRLEFEGSGEPAPDPAVERMAIRLGESAKRMGKTLTVVPMQSRDRRRVHVALANVEGVKTRSEGDGLFRRLLVEPEPR